MGRWPEWPSEVQLSVRQSRCMIPARLTIRKYFWETKFERSSHHGHGEIFAIQQPAWRSSPGRDKEVTGGYDMGEPISRPRCHSQRRSTQLCLRQPIALAVSSRPGAGVSKIPACEYCVCLRPRARCLLLRLGTQACPRQLLPRRACSTPHKSDGALTLSTGNEVEEVDTITR